MRHTIYVCSVFPRDTPSCHRVCRISLPASKYNYNPILGAMIYFFWMLVVPAILRRVRIIPALIKIYIYLTITMYTFLYEWYIVRS